MTYPSVTPIDFNIFYIENDGKERLYAMVGQREQIQQYIDSLIKDGYDEIIIKRVKK